MIAVMFEVSPHETRRDDYLDMAAQMNPLADRIHGFLSVDRSRA